MRRFHLEKEPFADTGERDFYFSTPALTARLEELCAATERGHVLLIDELGSGKSTMLESFIESARKSWQIFHLQAGEHAVGREFARTLISIFGLPIREPIAAQLTDADTFLALLTTRSGRAVIVIDDAHRLDHEALEQLLYLAKRWQSYSVRFLISAEPGFRESLALSSPGELFTAGATTLAMPRFDHEQVGDYLHMCLFHAGLVGDSPFDDRLVSEVVQRAQGLVGAIAPIARELLQAAADAQGSAGAAPRRTRRGPLLMVAAAGLGAMLTVAVPGVSGSGEGVESHAGRAAFHWSIIPARREAAGSRVRGSAPAGAAVR